MPSIGVEDRCMVVKMVLTLQQNLDINDDDENLSENTVDITYSKLYTGCLRSPDYKICLMLQFVNLHYCKSKKFNICNADAKINKQKQQLQSWFYFLSAKFAKQFARKKIYQTADLKDSISIFSKNIIFFAYFALFFHFL